MRINEITPYLTNVKPNGSGYICACPSCGDDHHLFINEKDGKVLVYCQKCGAGFNEILPLLNIPKPDRNDIAEQYDHVYKNPDGSVAYYKTRIKYMSGKKKFTFYHYVGDKKVYSKPKNCNALYNLDILHNADKSEVLYIVEGEKCADIMVKHGFVATTSNTGGGNEKIKFSRVDLDMLDSFDCKVIIPDNDEIGRKYAGKFNGAKVLDLRTIWHDIKPKDDIYDYIIKGGDLQAIRDYDFSATENTAAESGNSDSRGNVTKFTDQPASLKCGAWICDDSGVRKEDVSINGNVTVRYCSPIPVMPTEIITNIDTGVEKIRLEFNKGGWRSIICDRATTANNFKIIELANRGLEVNSDNSKHLVKYIADTVRLNLHSLPRAESVSRLGWIGNKFMPYCGDIHFDGERENKYLYESVAKNGSLDAWVDFMKPLRSNIYFRLMMAASFASPLIEKVNALPFVLHIWGATGTGKTVGLMAAMSVWGNPRMGKMTRTMNMTANAMLSTAAFLNSLPFGGDELQTIKSRWENYDNLIMKITEGIDRGRMSYDRNNEMKSWKCAFIFTGEEPCTKSASGGGAKNRAIEIECGEVVGNGNSVVGFINENHGLAGVRFIESLNKYDLRKEYDAIFSETVSLNLATDKQVMAMSLMLLGDKIASEQLFDESPLTLHDIKQFFTAPDEVDVSERAYDFAVNLCSRNLNRFKPASDGNVGEIWGKIDTKESVVFINKDIFISELAKEGFSFDAVKTKWLENGYTEKSGKGYFMHYTSCYGISAYFIKLKLPKEKLKTDALPFEENEK